MKKKVLIMAGYYLPSVKGGGPIQSIKNLVENLGDSYEFFIIASDRDLGDSKPFSQIHLNEWINVDNAMVYYTNMNFLNWRKLKSIFITLKCDVLYLNSFFSFKDSILPVMLMYLRKISFSKIIIAPRGQFSKGAIGLNRWKKKLYIRIAKIINLYKNIHWHATANSEKEDIQGIFGKKVNVTTINNFTANYQTLEFEKKIMKTSGELKIVFISRIHVKKNLLKALEFLKSIRGSVEFNIFGPIEDEVYWLSCMNVINNLPKNIKVSYKGTLKHNYIMDIFKSHHILLLPTLGENFGHVISEALIGGCPVIISDQTPWRNLDKFNVGWDINLHDENKFVEVIQKCVDLNESDYIKMSISAFNYAKKSSNKSTERLEYKKLFNHSEFLNK
jgi:glycosyltransferase involved in cell wall biosynthesis